MRTETGAWTVSCLKGQTGSLLSCFYPRSEEKGHPVGWWAGEGSHPCLWGNWADGGESSYGWNSWLTSPIALNKLPGLCEDLIFPQCQASLRPANLVASVVI